MPYSPLDLANAYIQAGELDDALEALTTHLDSTPEDIPVRRLRIAVLLRLPGREQDALNDLEMLPQLTDDDVIYKSALLEQIGKLDQAVEVVSTAYANGQRADRIAERWVGLLLQQGRLTEAADVLATLPETWRWLQWRGDIAVQRGDHAAALTAYHDVLAALETHSGLWIGAVRARVLLARAGVFERMGRIQLAEADYLAAGELIPNDPMIPFNRGLLAALRGDITEAVILCDDSLRRANEALRAHMVATLRADPRLSALAAELLPNG